MSHNPTRVTCKCGKGKVSAWDGKCGHCRTRHEEAIHKLLREGYTPERAAMKAIR